MFICALYAYSYVSSISLYPGSFQISLLLLLPFGFPFSNLFLFSSFLYILSFALTVVDANLLEYLSESTEMGETLTAEEY